MEDWERIPATSSGKSKEDATTGSTTINPDEIAIGDEDDEVLTNVESTAPHNPDEISFSDEEDDEIPSTPAPATSIVKADNPDEITFDDDEGEDAPKEDIVFKPESADPAATSSTEIPAAEARKALEVDESVDLVEAVRKGEASAGDPTNEPTSASQMAVPQTADAETTTEVKDLEPGQAGPSRPTGRQTKFLALDKVLPGRDFIQVSHPSPPVSSLANANARLVPRHPNSPTYHQSST